MIPAVAASVLFVLGLSYLVQAPRWLRLLQSWADRPERLLLPAVVMVAAGVALGYGIDDRTGTWPIFITVLGWLLAIEGAVLLLAPGLVSRLLSLPERFLLIYTRSGGLLLLVLGALLWRHYW